MGSYLQLSCNKVLDGVMSRRPLGEPPAMLQPMLSLGTESVTQSGIVSRSCHRCAGE